MHGIGRGDAGILTKWRRTLVFPPCTTLKLHIPTDGVAEVSTNRFETRECERDQRAPALTSHHQAVEAVCRVQMFGYKTAGVQMLRVLKIY